MSAGDTLEDKRKRRRELRRQAAEATPVDSVEAEDELMEDDEDDGEDSGRGISERKGRATPSRRAQLEVEEAKAEGNFITRPLRGLRDYIEGVRSEVQKVAWPTREETRRLTIIVLVVTILASITLGVISLAYQRFSYVADHFQYLANIAPLAVVAALLVRLIERVTSGQTPGSPEANRAKQAKTALRAISGVLVIVLVVLTWRQGRLYKDEVTIWTHTVGLNPATA